MELKIYENVAITQIKKITIKKVNNYTYKYKKTRIIIT